MATFCMCCSAAPFLPSYRWPPPLQASWQLLQQMPAADGAQGGREAAVFKEAAAPQAPFPQGLIVLSGEL